MRMNKLGVKIRVAHLLHHNVINQDLMNFVKLILLNLVLKTMKEYQFALLIISRTGVVINRSSHNMNAEIRQIN